MIDWLRWLQAWRRKRLLQTLLRRRRLLSMLLLHEAATQS